MPTQAYRNVMLLIADDWSPIARCYGNDVIQTPNIDRLAQRSTVFDQAFCVSPSCAVSRACLLTGLYPHQHGQYGHCHSIQGFRTHEHVRSVPAVLNEHGVRNALIGKVHVAPQSVYPFEIFDGTSLRDPQRQAQMAGDWLKSIDGAPFHLHLASFFPHRWSGDSQFGLERDIPGVTDVTYGPADVVVPDFLPDHPHVRADLANYYSAISRFDAFVGMQLEMLEASGRADDTLVILLSDHGMPFPGAKASNFDTGHRCPLIIHRPGQARTQRTDAVCNWLDVTATIYDWIGVEPGAWQPRVEGRSLLPVLERPDTPGWDQTCFSHCFHEVVNYYPYRVLRGRRHKYVRNLAWQCPVPLPTDLYRSRTWRAVAGDGLTMMGRRPTEHFRHQRREALYDIEQDPVETNNLIDDPALADVAESMRRQVMDWQIRTQDPWLEVRIQDGDPGAPTHAKG